MNKLYSLAGALTLAATPTLAADAETLRELQALRTQLQQLQQGYEARINALEARLQQTENKAIKAETLASQTSERPQTPPAEPARANAFNPEISLIISGSYNNLKQKPEAYQITGFTPTLGEVGPGSRGFSLGETELVLSANVDPAWRGTAIAALKPEGGVAMENAYIESLGLGQGFNFKAGRFFSGLGYLNEHHRHAWDFADAPLAYQAFLGGKFGQDGVQLRWLAPTETFLELGVEAGTGQSFPASARDKNGSTAGVVFARLGGDLGDSHSWRIGLSALGTSPRERAYTDPDSGADQSFSGRSRLWVADGVWKWAPAGNSSVTHFKLQGEYFRRQEKGDLASNSAAGSCAGDCRGSYESRQSGAYLQGVYQFMPRWRTGLRYDRLDYGTVHLGLVDNGTLASTDLPALAPHSPSRRSLMLDYSPSEFSRFRLQLARDESGLGRSDHQVFLQYIQSLGAHGAHKF